MGIDVIAYHRFSSSNQREESIDAQKRAIKIYCIQMKYTIVASYSDRAKSGRSGNRPDFLQMIQDIQNGTVKAKYLIVHKFDRFFRNVADSSYYEQILKEHGVELISVAEQLDNSPMGKAMRQIISVLNELYADNLATETMKGLKENAYKCLTTGGKPPLGYDYVDKQHVINPVEAEAVALAFKLYDEGYGYLTIIRELNRLGYTTKTGKGFGKNSLYEIFRNEKYKGVYVYNKATSRKRDGSRSRKQKPDTEIIRIEGGVPAIVDTAVWDRVNAMMDRRKKAPAASKAKHTYLLSGLIYCGECGYTMHGNARKPSPTRDVLITYRCCHRHNKAACANREIKRDAVESFVLAQLEKHFFHEGVVPALTKELNQYLSSSNVEQEHKKERLSHRLKELEKQKSNIVEAITKSGYSDIFQGQLVKIQQELEAVQSEQQQMKQELVTIQITEDMVRDYLGQFRQFVKERNIPQIKNFIDSYVERVEVYQEYIKVTFKVTFSIFSDRFEADRAYYHSVQMSRRQLRGKMSA